MHPVSPLQALQLEMAMSECRRTPFRNQDPERKEKGDPTVSTNSSPDSSSQSEETPLAPFRVSGTQD